METSVRIRMSRRNQTLPTHSRNYKRGSSGRTSRKEDPRDPTKRESKNSTWHGSWMNAGCAGRSGNSGRGGCGQGGCGRGASATVPRKASEVGACKNLEGKIFTIGLGNKGKDGECSEPQWRKWLPNWYQVCQWGCPGMDQQKEDHSFRAWLLTSHTG
jgi:hypothetical protein